MPYLVDGHNLIGQLPDIDLSDPHDEAKLVLKLRRFAARVNKQITVVFDNGIPAGFDRSLSNGPVRVRFSSSRSTADDILKKMIRSQGNASGWTIITSDSEVRRIAMQCGMNVITSHQFARDLTNSLRKAPPSEEAAKQNPRLTPQEIDEWLSIFGDGNT